jgi:hypothetical protein
MDFMIEFLLGFILTFFGYYLMIFTRKVNYLHYEVEQLSVRIDNTRENMKHYADLEEKVNHLYRDLQVLENRVNGKYSTVHLYESS